MRISATASSPRQQPLAALRKRLANAKLVEVLRVLHAVTQQHFRAQEASEKSCGNAVEVEWCQLDAQPACSSQPVESPLVPREFLDPVVGDLLINPVRGVDGKIYERRCALAIARQILAVMREAAEGDGPAAVAALNKSRYAQKLLNTSLAQVESLRSRIARWQRAVESDEQVTHLLGPTHLGRITLIAPSEAPSTAASQSPTTVIVVRSVAEGVREARRMLRVLVEERRVAPLPVGSVVIDELLAHSAAGGSSSGSATVEIEAAHLTALPEYAVAMWLDRRFAGARGSLSAALSASHHHEGRRQRTSPVRTPVGPSALAADGGTGTSPDGCFHGATLAVEGLNPATHEALQARDRMKKYAQEQRFRAGVESAVVPATVPVAPALGHLRAPVVALQPPPPMPTQAELAVAARLRRDLLVLQRSENTHRNALVMEYWPALYLIEKSALDAETLVIAQLAARADDDGDDEAPRACVGSEDAGEAGGAATGDARSSGEGVPNCIPDLGSGSSSGSPPRSDVAFGRDDAPDPFAFTFTFQSATPKAEALDAHVPGNDSSVLSLADDSGNASAEVAAAPPRQRRQSTVHELLELVQDGHHARRTSVAQLEHDLEVVRRTQSSDTHSTAGAAASAADPDAAMASQQQQCSQAPAPAEAAASLFLSTSSFVTSNGKSSPAESPEAMPQSLGLAADDARLLRDLVNAAVRAVEEHEQLGREYEAERSGTMGGDPRSALSSTPLMQPRPHVSASASNNATPTGELSALDGTALRGAAGFAPPLLPHERMHRNDAPPAHPHRSGASIVAAASHASSRARTPTGTPQVRDGIAVAAGTGGVKAQQPATASSLGEGWPPSDPQTPRVSRSASNASRATRTTSTAGLNDTTRVIIGDDHINTARSALGRKYLINNAKRAESDGDDDDGAASDDFLSSVSKYVAMMFTAHRRETQDESERVESHRQLMRVRRDERRQQIDTACAFRKGLSPKRPTSVRRVPVAACCVVAGPLCERTQVVHVKPTPPAKRLDSAPAARQCRRTHRSELPSPLGLARAHMSDPPPRSSAMPLPVADHAGPVESVTETEAADHDGWAGCPLLQNTDGATVRRCDGAEGWKLKLAEAAAAAEGVSSTFDAPVAGTTGPLAGLVSQSLRPWPACIAAHKPPIESSAHAHLPSSLPRASEVSEAQIMTFQTGSKPCLQQRKRRAATAQQPTPPAPHTAIADTMRRQWHSAAAAAFSKPRVVGPVVVGRGTTTMNTWRCGGVAEPMRSAGAVVRPSELADLFESTGVAEGSGQSSGQPQQRSTRQVAAAFRRSYDESSRAIFAL